MTHAAQDEDVGRTPNRGTSTMTGKLGKFFQEGKIKVAFKERARINSPEMGKWTSILGRRNSINEGLEIERDTSFLRNKEKKPEPRMLRRGTGDTGQSGTRAEPQNPWGSKEFAFYPKSIRESQMRFPYRVTCIAPRNQLSVLKPRPYLHDFIPSDPKVPLKTNSVDQHTENIQDGFQVVSTSHF